MAILLRQEGRKATRCRAARKSAKLMMEEASRLRSTSVAFPPMPRQLPRSCKRKLQGERQLPRSNPLWSLLASRRTRARQPSEVGEGSWGPSAVGGMALLTAIDLCNIFRAPRGSHGSFDSWPGFPPTSPAQNKKKILTLGSRQLALAAGQLRKSSLPELYLPCLIIARQAWH